MANKITPISETDRNALKRKTAATLPDNPAAHGMKAAAVKPKFWQALVEGEDSIAGIINRMINEINKAFNESDNKHAGHVTGVAYDKQRCSLSVSFGDGSVKHLDADLRGNGIADIQKTASKGLVDTYTVYMTDGNTESFCVKNGEQGPRGVPGEITYSQLLTHLLEEREQTNSAIEAMLAAARSYTDAELAEFDFIKVVEKLPSQGQPNKLYLVPKASIGTNDLFDEYVWADGAWEHIVTKQISVDLTPYVKKTDIIDEAHGGTGAVSLKSAFFAFNKRLNLFDFLNLVLLDQDMYINAGFVSVDHISGSIQMTAAYEDNYCYITDAVVLEPNTQYTLSAKGTGGGQFFVEFSDGNLQASTVSTTPTITFTTPEDGVIFIRLDNDEPVGKPNTFTNFMLNVGPGAAPYEPFDGGAIARFGPTTVHSVVSRYKKVIGNILYPVGSIYMSMNATSPAELFGGTWAPIGGRFLLGAGSNDKNTTDAYGSIPANVFNRPVGERGGEIAHKLTIDEMPKHTHKTDHNATPISHNGGSQWAGLGNGDTIIYWCTTTSNSAGNDSAHNNLPPYQVVYMWYRYS